MFDPDFSADAKKRLHDRYNTEVKTLGELKARLDAFGATEDVRQRRWQITRARHLAQYAVMSKELRKAAQREVFEAVWVWPDGALWVQRKGVTVDLAERPVYKAGREIGFGLDWPLLDAERIRADLLRVIDAAKLGPPAFSKVVSPHTARRLIAQRGNRVGLGVLVRMYHHALHIAPKVSVPDDVYRPDYLDAMSRWLSANAGKHSLRAKCAESETDIKCDKASLNAHSVHSIDFEEFRELVCSP
jgi:hypothetical protein